MAMHSIDIDPANVASNKKAPMGAFLLHLRANRTVDEEVMDIQAIEPA